MDINAREQVAAEQVRPLKEQATAKGQQAAQWSQRVADLKKAKPRDDQTIEDAETKVKELTPMPYEHKINPPDTHSLCR